MPSWAQKRNPKARAGKGGGVGEPVQRLGYGIDDRGSIPGRRCDGYPLFVTASRPALGPHPTSYKDPRLDAIVSVFVTSVCK